MSWRLAGSLITLRSQINEKYPNRSKASDGTIGDAAHSSKVSQHNPNSAGVVTAIDFTHSPGHLDCNWLAEVLTDNKDSRLWYVIWNRRIWENGVWKAYSGSNPHTKHLHVSATQSAARYDIPNKWNLTKGEPPMTPEQEAQAYQIVLGRNPEGAPSGRTGWQFIVGAKPELDAVRAAQAKMVADLRVALENAKNKPAEKVIVQVEKIVEKAAPVDEKLVVENVVKRFWNSLFKK